MRHLNPFRRTSADPDTPTPGSRGEARPGVGANPADLGCLPRGPVVGGLPEGGPRARSHLSGREPQGHNHVARPPVLPRDFDFIDFEPAPENRWWLNDGTIFRRTSKWVAQMKAGEL